MARRRPKTTERDDAATAFPAEADVAGLEATADDTSRGEQFGEIGAFSDVDRSGETARRAYERYQERGGEHGHDQQDWYEAERELRRRR
jgi:hypothetical protein